jgi:hypothetical protein
MEYLIFMCNRKFLLQNFLTMLENSIDNSTIFPMNFSTLHVTGSMLTLLCWSVALITIVVGIHILATVVVTTHCSIQQKLDVSRKQEFFLQIFNANSQIKY